MSLNVCIQANAVEYTRGVLQVLHRGEFFDEVIFEFCSVIGQSIAAVKALINSALLAIASLQESK